jgi:hypothetical protein
MYGCFSEGVPAYETEEMTKLRKSISSENDSPAASLPGILNRLEKNMSTSCK